MNFDNYYELAQFLIENPNYSISNCLVDGMKIDLEELRNELEMIYDPEDVYSQDDSDYNSVVRKLLVDIDEEIHYNNEMANKYQTVIGNSSIGNGSREKIEAIKALIDSVMYYDYFVDVIMNEDSDKANKESMESIEEIFGSLPNSDSTTLEEFAKRLQEKGDIPISPDALDMIFSKFSANQKANLKKRLKEVVYRTENDSDITFEGKVERRSLELGKSFGKLGLALENIPSIALEDIDFIFGYLSYLSEDGRVLTQDNYGYGRCLADVAEVKRYQMEQDLIDEKNNNKDLKTASEKFAEAEALVSKIEGKQQE